jgi:hypothetical protein
MTQPSHYLRRTVKGSGAGLMPDPSTLAFGLTYMGTLAYREEFDKFHRRVRPCSVNGD